MPRDVRFFEESETDHAAKCLRWLIDKGWVMDLGQLGDGWRELRVPPQLAARIDGCQSQDNG